MLFELTLVKYKKMNKIQTVFRIVLLYTFSILFINCNKDVVEPEVPIVNYSNFTDSRDGKIYKTTKIKNQEWMAENLSFKVDNGSWNAGGSEEYAKFGRLYTWDAAKKAVPLGWHLPSDAEWKQLEMVLGMSQEEADATEWRGTNIGIKLKALNVWADTGKGTDDVGFTALPGGFRSNSSSTYYAINFHGYWWTASEYDNSTAWFRYLSYKSTQVFRKYSFKEEAYSVRCVKD